MKAPTSTARKFMHNHEGLCHVTQWVMVFIWYIVTFWVQQSIQFFHNQHLFSLFSERLDGIKWRPPPPPLVSHHFSLLLLPATGLICEKPSTGPVHSHACLHSCSLRRFHWLLQLFYYHLILPVLLLLLLRFYDVGCYCCVFMIFLNCVLFRISPLSSGPCHL